MQTNPKLELARKYVEQTKSNIFLTGRAGTGKTTFLKSIVKDMKHKRFVVLAPTGIAALNAEGQTIHSFLQLELTPYIPGSRLPAKKFRKDKLNLIRSLDLIIIDEISMVRADLLDQIDRVLRKLRYRHAHQAFGGVQMLLIGDLSQLPPVATGQDWDILSQYYDTPYFFSAQIWQDTAFHTIELDHIYRLLEAASALEIFNYLLIAYRLCGGGIWTKKPPLVKRGDLLEKPLLHHHINAEVNSRIERIAVVKIKCHDADVYIACTLA